MWPYLGIQWTFSILDDDKDGGSICVTCPQKVKQGERERGEGKEVGGGTEARYGNSINHFFTKGEHICRSLVQYLFINGQGEKIGQHRLSLENIF